MRKFLALFVALAAVLAACGGPAAVTGDPYELIRRSQAANWDRVQVEIGINVTGPEAISVDPSALRFAFDQPAGKANIHVALPIAALGDEAAQLRALGIAGDTLELDLIFDGQALYAKSPLGSMLGMLMLQAGEVPPGDMTGWLRLLSKEDFEALESLGGDFGGGMVPLPDDLPIPSAADVATLKSLLDEMGITLTHAGTASRNGVDAEKVTAAVDLAKLVASEHFGELDTPIDLEPGDGTLSFDLFFDRSNSRLVGVDVHATSTSEGSAATVTINIGEPSVSFDAPAGAVEVPVMEMLGTFMETFGGGMFPQ